MQSATALLAPAHGRRECAGAQWVSLCPSQWGGERPRIINLREPRKAMSHKPWEWCRIVSHVIGENGIPSYHLVVMSNEIKKQRLIPLHLQAAVKPVLLRGEETCTGLIWGAHRLWLNTGGGALCSELYKTVLTLGSQVANLYCFLILFHEAHTKACSAKLP